MNIIVHGIDIVDCRRLESLTARHGRRFLDRVYTAREQAYCGRFVKRSAEHWAGRFAVKEAVMKALGTGWRGGIAWTDIETVNDPAGKPMVRLAGKVAQRAAELGIAQFSISISHAGGMAVASAVALAADNGSSD